MTYPWARWPFLILAGMDSYKFLMYSTQNDLPISKIVSYKSSTEFISHAWVCSFRLIINQAFSIVLKSVDGRPFNRKDNVVSCHSRSMNWSIIVHKNIIILRKMSYNYWLQVIIYNFNVFIGILIAPFTLQSVPTPS